MSTVTAPVAPETTTPVAAPAAAPITVTEKAADQVRKFVAQQQATGQLPEKVYLRVRVVGGGCSGFQNKLDLDQNYNEKLDELYDFHGISVVVDKRSLMYLSGATVDFHDELHRSGFSISNPNAKGSCGCGSSYTM